jgi:predicted CxxxxCH...CXXCH cytochrome family protein
VHPQGIVDPSSDQWHGKLLRDARYAPMIDANDPNACGRCHDGAPAKPAGVTFAAPGAPACTTCHSQPAGVLDCSTCHDVSKTGAHAAHVSPSPSRATGLACGTCHPTPGPDIFGGMHVDGQVEVIFDTALVAPEASYSRDQGTCAVSCHDRGGARPRLAWSERGPLSCGDCHRSPPAGHFVGACTGCHREANAEGTALTLGPLHVNGKVDLGDGSGKCGACHGRTDDDPWPTTGAHASHEAPSLAAPFECTSCHRVPRTLLEVGHLDGVVEVTFGVHAVDRGASPSWDGATCTSVACHGANLVDPPAVVPTWKDTSGAARACGACHGIPPTQHSPSKQCGRAECHGSEVVPDAQGAPTITASGKALHVNGVIDLRAP